MDYGFAVGAIKATEGKLLDKNKLSKLFKLSIFSLSSGFSIFVVASSAVISPGLNDCLIWYAITSSLCFVVRYVARFLWLQCEKSNKK